jgi:hypothetical protein
MLKVDYSLIEPEIFRFAAERMASDIWQGGVSGMCAAIDRVLGERGSYGDALTQEYWNYVVFLEMLIGPNERMTDNDAYYGDGWAAGETENQRQKANASRVIGLLFAYEFAKDFAKERNHEAS